MATPRFTDREAIKKSDSLRSSQWQDAPLSLSSCVTSEGSSPSEAKARQPKGVASESGHMIVYQILV